MFFTNASADDRVSSKADKLAFILSDLYSSEYKAARKYKELKASKYKIYILAAFTLEGFKGGNNWTQFLGVFEKTQKTDDYGKPLGDADYYLVGYTELSAKFRPIVDFESASYESQKFIFNAKTRAGESTSVVVNIDEHSVALAK